MIAGPHITVEGDGDGHEHQHHPDRSLIRYQAGVLPGAVVERHVRHELQSGNERPDYPEGEQYYGDFGSGQFFVEGGRTAQSDVVLGGDGRDREHRHQETERSQEPLETTDREVVAQSCEDHDGGCRYHQTGHQQIGQRHIHNECIS